MENLILHSFGQFKSIVFKGTLLLAGLLVFAVTIKAQAPASFSYQAVVRDLSNNPIANTTLGVRITILRGSAAGSNVFRETHSPITNSAGLVSLEVGMGTNVNGDLESIDWNNGPYFIEQAIDPNGGTNYTITGTTQLLSVPYALYSRNAGRAESAAQADIANSLSAAAAGPFSIPLGSILPYAGPASSVPSGWELCDGESFDINTYPELYALIGYTYGAESGRFRVPNLNGRTPVGMDGSQVEFDALGETGGDKTHILNLNEMPSHTHTGTAVSNGGHTHNWRYPFSSSENGDGRVSILGDDNDTGDAFDWIINTSMDGAHIHDLSIAATGGGAPHNNLQPYLAINFIIKVK